MSIKAVLFDLDGTLLPMDQDAFTKGYFKLLAKKVAPYQYKPQELIDAVWQGTAAMVQNDGTQSNEAAFWRRFAEIYGAKAMDDKPVFDAFYRVEFQEARAFCGYNPKAADAVRTMKSMGFRLALATNPIFPASATESRIRWAGLAPEDFALCTTYENCGFCKPNTRYYLDVANRLGVSPAECLLVGNDVAEDMVAEAIGMHVFLLSDCLINKKQKDISGYPSGGFDAFINHMAQIKSKESVE